MEDNTEQEDVKVEPTITIGPSGEIVTNSLNVTFEPLETPHFSSKRTFDEITKDDQEEIPKRDELSGKRHKISDEA